jgi:hypothetical protein
LARKPHLLLGKTIAGIAPIVRLFGFRVTTSGEMESMSGSAVITVILPMKEAVGYHLDTHITEMVTTIIAPVIGLTKDNPKLSKIYQLRCPSSATGLKNSTTTDVT